jgi:hypothetical protein
MHLFTLKVTLPLHSINFADSFVYWIGYEVIKQINQEMGYYTKFFDIVAVFFRLVQSTVVVIII